VGLSDDQKAMLRLLAQREEGYEDMAKLMGISVEEVRERVKEALAEVDEPVPAPEALVEPAAVTPAAPTPSPPQAAEPPSPLPPASTSSDRIPPAPAAPKASRPRQPLPSLKLPKDRGALIGLGAGVLVLVALAIVLILSGGEGSDSDRTAGTDQDDSALSGAEERNLTQAVLVPTGDADASGRALFGRFKRNVLLQVEAEGLEPSPAGQSYTVWLYRSPKLALQVGAVRVEDSGEIAAQFQIPAQLLTYVANGAFDQVDISLTSIPEYKAAFNQAKSENKVPPYIGESVLRGEITGPAIQPQKSAE
jgi:hypothetical protein